MTRVLFRSATNHVYSVDLVMAYDSSRASVKSVEKTASSESLLFASNTNKPGTIQIGLAGASPLTGDGALVALTFQSNAAAGLHIVQATVNEGSPSAFIAADAAAFDSDGDGLLDADESLTYLTDPSKADSDGDGMNDGLEVLAGTNPDDAASVFRLTTVRLAAGNKIIITWTSVPDRSYQLLSSQTLEGSLWTTIGGTIQATGFTSSITNSPVTGDAPHFYRVQILTQ